MIKYILRRLVQAIPTFFGITLISYFLVWASPGSIVDRILFGPEVRPEQREALAAQLGVNDPFRCSIYAGWLATIGCGGIAIVMASPMAAC